MLKPSDFYQALRDSGVSLFAGVPDSLLKDICAYVTDHTPPERNIITSNEGSAIALAMGHYLATGNVGLVYLQNSGVGNTVNPLTSLADPAVYGIPMLLMVGWRGRPGEHDEPQHVKMGAVTVETLSAIGVPTTVLPDELGEAKIAIEKALGDARARSAPHALLIKKGTFEAYKLQRKDTNPYAMSREEAIEGVVAALPDKACVVATTGMPSRELFEIREKRGQAHEADFLTVGGMGHASQIALGIALERAGLPVYCLDGDGAVLMHLGGITTIGQQKPRNYKHIVLNNGAHDSVGGQPTVGFAVDLCAIARAAGYERTWLATTRTELDAALSELTVTDGPVMCEVRVKKGARSDLGRPTMSPQELKVVFSKTVRS